VDALKDVDALKEAATVWVHNVVGLGVATNSDTSKMYNNQAGFGGKRTKKRSTNKKCRIHKKRGRMSKIR